MVTGLLDEGEAELQSKLDESVTKEVAGTTTKLARRALFANIREHSGKTV